MASTPPRVAAHLASPAPSVTSSAASPAVTMENASFVSLLSAGGRGMGVIADLDSISAAAATVLRTPPPTQVSHEERVPLCTSDGRQRDQVQPPASETATDDLNEADDVSIWRTVKQFLVVGYPLTISNIAQFSLMMVVASVNGKMLGDEQLGGVSLAVGLMNATGFAFGNGLCGALEITLSHTYGAYEREVHMIEVEKARREELRVQTIAAASPGGTDGACQSADEAVGKDTSDVLDGATADAGELREPPRTLHMYGTYGQRMLIILLVAAFPLGAILIFADYAMHSLGESAVVLYYTGEFCRLAVFGMPAMLLFPMLQRYYSCQRVTKPLSVTMIIAALVNPVLQIAFVKLFGFHGSPIAWLLMMSGACVGLVGYLWKTGLYKFTWGGFDEKSVQHLGSMVSIALPSMTMVLTEWVALEINALAAGFAPTNELAAYSITQQVFGVMWGMGAGVMTLSCVFVGGAIGARKPMAAKKIALIAIGLIVCIAIFDIILVLLFSPVIPWLFTNDQEVVNIYHKLMRVVLPYHICNVFQVTVLGIMRGVEKPQVGALMTTTVFCVVGVPLSFLLFFYFDIGVIALWIGPFFGVAVVGVPLYMWVILKYIPWSELRPHTDEKRKAGGLADSDGCLADDSVPPPDDLAQGTAREPSRGSPPSEAGAKRRVSDVAGKAASPAADTLKAQRNDERGLEKRRGSE